MRRLGVVFFALVLLAGAGAGPAVPTAAASASENPVFLYSVNDGVANSVSAYTVLRNGGLRQITGSPFLTGGAGDAALPEGFAFISARTADIARAGNRLYVANMGSSPATISAFTINPRTGSLRSLPGSPYALGFTGEFSLVVAPDGSRVYAAQATAHNVEVLPIKRDGSLDARHRADTETSIITIGMAISPDGRWLAIAGVTDMAAETMDIKSQVFAISSRTGSLTEAAGSPLSMWATAVAFGPSHHGSTTLFAATANGEVFNYAVTPRSITKISGVTINSKVSGLQSIAVTPDGSTVYTAEPWSQSLYSFRVDRHGILSQTAGPVLVGPARVVEGLALAPDGKRLYFTMVGEDTDAGSPGSIGAVRLGSHGSMTVTVPGMPVATGLSGYLRSIVLVEGESR